MDSFHDYLAARSHGPVRYRPNGLLRCCIDSVRHAPRDAEEGDLWPCPQCRVEMVYKAGAWQWPMANEFLANPVREA